MGSTSIRYISGLMSSLAGIILLVLSTQIAFSAVVVSNGTGGGDWNTGSTWVGGSTPGNNDDVVIQSGDTIAFPNSATINRFTLDGVLKFQNNRQLTLKGSAEINGTIITEGCPLGTCGRIRIRDADTLFVNNPIIADPDVRFRFTDTHGGEISGTGSLTDLEIAKDATLLPGSDISITTRLRGAATLFMDDSSIVRNNSIEDVPLKLSMSPYAEYYNNLNHSFTTSQLDFDTVNAKVYYRGAGTLNLKKVPYWDVHLELFGDVFLQEATVNVPYEILGEIFVEPQTTLYTSNGSNILRDLVVGDTMHVRGAVIHPNEGIGSYRDLQDVKVYSGGIWRNSGGADCTIGGDIISLGDEFTPGSGTYFMGDPDGILVGPTFISSGQNPINMTIADTAVVTTYQDSLWVDRLLGDGLFVQSDSVVTTLVDGCSPCPFNLDFDATASGNTVIYTGPGNDFLLGRDYFNLILEKDSVFRIQTVANTIIRKLLNLKLGNLFCANNLTLRKEARIIGGSDSSYVILTGSRIIKKEMDTIGRYFFPIGKTVYSPMYINFRQPTGVQNNSSVSIGIAEVRHPNFILSTDWIKRFWTVNGVGLSDLLYDIEYYYDDFDIVGVERKMAALKWDGFWQKYDSVDEQNNRFYINDLTFFSDFTGGQEASKIKYSIRTDNYNTIGTWSDFRIGPTCNCIPDSCATAIIQNGDTVTINQDNKLLNLIIEPGGALKFEDGARHIIHGNYTNIGIYIRGDGITELRKDAALRNLPHIITGSTDFNNLEINNNLGASVSFGTNKIWGSLILTTGNLSTLGNEFIIASDANETGLIDDFTDPSPGQVIGDVTVQRYIGGPGRGFHYIGSPVQNMTVADLQDDFVFGNDGPDGAQFRPNDVCLGDSSHPDTPYDNFWEYRESADSIDQCGQFGWHIKNSGNLQVGRGYAGIIRNGTVLDYVGDDHTGNYTYFGLTNSNNLHPNYGYNLVSNPYPSPLDWGECHADNTDLDAACYVWNSTGYYSGTYAVKLANVNDTIALGQAFLVHLSAPHTSTNFTTAQTHRTRANPSFIRQGPWYDQMIDVVVEGNGFADHAITYFTKNATDEFDPRFDGFELGGNSDQPQVSFAMPTVDLSLNALPPLTDDREIELNFTPGSSGAFKFIFKDVSTLPQTALVYFEDRLNGHVQDLRLVDEYEFTALSGDDYSGRFYLRFAPPMSIIGLDQSCDDNDGAIELEQNGSTLWNYTLFSDTGDSIQSGLNFNGALSISDLSEENYSLRLTHASGYSVEELIYIRKHEAVSASFVTDYDQRFVGEEITFTNQSVAETNYFWDFGDGTTLNDIPHPVHAYQSAGLYEVEMVASNLDCADAASKEVDIQDYPVGQEDIFADNALLCYAHGGNIYLQIGGQEAAKVLISDFLGRNLFESKVQSGILHKVDLPDHAGGVVLVSIQTDSDTHVARLYLSR